MHRDLAPLAGALRATPSCLLHGDPRTSNMGTAADGRTVLIDRVYVGESPAGHDLGRYLALDRARPPVSKEDTIEMFRALEGDGDELGWWCEAALQGLRRL